MKDTRPYCIELKRPSLLFCYYAFVDTADHLAIDLLSQNKTYIKFAREYRNENDKYCVIMCRVRKADRAHFLDAMLQVPKKMLLCGNPDYLDYCADLMKELGVPMEDT